MCKLYNLYEWFGIWKVNCEHETKNNSKKARERGEKVQFTKGLHNRWRYISVNFTYYNLYYNNDALFLVLPSFFCVLTTCHFKVMVCNLYKESLLVFTTFHFKVFILEQSDSETVYMVPCHNKCLPSSFDVLPLCYVLNLPLVFDIFDIAYDGIICERFWIHEKKVFRCIVFVRHLFIREMRKTERFFSRWKMWSATGSLSQHFLGFCGLSKSGSEWTVISEY